MKAPLSWLADFVAVKESPQKLAENLQFTGTKVESIETRGDDTIVDFEITPNRADCLSLIGIAREIAAIYERKVSIPPTLEDTTIETSKPFEFVVEDKKLCPRYTIGVIDQVKVQKSPPWISNRLEMVSIRPTNNIVDITNYCMLETGQPMHAFDYDKLVGKIRLRSSKAGEKIKTLDNIDRTLPKGAAVIEDSEKLIDLAGLMGGENSQIDENTTTLLLHVPVYDPVVIRRTSQFLGLRTEASNIFEKKIDPAVHRYAFERAAFLLRETAQGKIASKIKSIGYPVEGQSISVSPNFIRGVLGITLRDQTIKNILARLGFAHQEQNEDSNKILKVKVPTYRTDLNQPIDLVEEVSRIYGYNKFPMGFTSGQLPVFDISKGDFDKKLRSLLANLGLKEVYTDSLTSSVTLENLGIRSEGNLKVSNRLVADYEYLRPSLFTGLVAAASNNQKNFDKFSLFEIGKVFDKNRLEKNLTDQPKKVGAIFVDFDFGQSKGILEALLDKLYIKSHVFRPAQDSLVFSDAAQIQSKGKLLGHFGRLRKETLTKYELSQQTFGFEIDLEILQEESAPASYKPPLKYPTVKENISMFLPKDLLYSSISESIKKTAGASLYNLSLVEDTFIKGRRSILVKVEYFHPERTLTNKESAQIRNKITAALKDLAVEVR